MEQLEARMEARMNEALVAQRTALIAELGSGNGNGASTVGRDPATPNQGPAAAPTSSNTALNLDDMPSRTTAGLEAQKMKEKLELLERSGKTYPTLQAWECPVNKGTFGLSYEPTDEDLVGRTRGRKKKGIQMWPYFLTLNGHFCKPGETIPYCSFQEPFYCLTAKKMLPELEIEDLMQPGLFDEYTEEEHAADKTLPEPNLESGPDVKSCTESEFDPESEIESESSSESSVSDLENPDFKFDVIF
ncbi:hypothetical protein JCGZ_19374 [Jatropha curcas]|uniref:Uncharacterized protein n=1 Tax=Jatropha curcas TaxID=180498 RepID=A0A067KAU3_JATCU|nr:hypothetical protein JCGZ_19374 [Jatropha curcas]